MWATQPHLSQNYKCFRKIFWCDYSGHNLIRHSRVSHLLVAHSVLNSCEIRVFDDYDDVTVDKRFKHSRDKSKLRSIQHVTVVGIDIHLWKEIILWHKSKYLLIFHTAPRWTYLAQVRNTANSIVFFICHGYLCSQHKKSGGFQSLKNQILHQSLSSLYQI